MSNEAEPKKQKRLDPTQHLMLLKQIAALDMARVPVTQIAPKVGCNRWQVAKILKSEEYRVVLERLTDKAILPALAQARDGFGKLVSEALRVVQERLKENRLDAAKMVFEGVGAFEHKDDKGHGDTAIQIVLPGGADVATFEVPSSKAEVEYDN